MNKRLLNFWKQNAKNIFWFTFPKNIFEFKNDFFKWYDDGKTNVALNCLEHKDFDTSKKIALIYCDKNKNILKFTYNELSNYVSKFAHYIQNFKFKNKRIKILIHGSASIETSISMLASAKLGFEHCVIFENLSKEALELRIKLFKPNLIISRCDIIQYKNDIKPIIGKYPKISFIHFSENKINVLLKNKINLKYLKKYDKFENKYSIVKSNNNLFTLFTSGSTGIPKGVIHSSGGYLSYAKYTCSHQFGMNNKSIVLTASDAGWINGHTYALYGPLSCGATTVILETPISLLDEEFMKNILNDFKITILYLPVTLIRLMKSVYNKKNIKNKYLKTLGSMGEALAPSIGTWYSIYFSLKNNAIINTYFQTETGGIICSPTFNESKMSSPHGSVGKPITNFLDISNKSKKYNNEFLIKNLWPGCMINLVNGKKEWKKYWTEKKYFRMFDISFLDNKNNFYIQGRVDDVINIRGHRIGTAEIESILLKYTMAKEVSAISAKDELEGDIVILFISAKNKKDIKIESIEKNLIKYFGTYAIPKEVFIIKELPKTRSGKILRRLLRTLYENPNKKDIGDISTMINKNSIDDIRKSIISSNHN